MSCCTSLRFDRCTRRHKFSVLGLSNVTPIFFQKLAVDLPCRDPENRFHRASHMQDVLGGGRGPRSDGHRAVSGHPGCPEDGRPHNPGHRPLRIERGLCLPGGISALLSASECVPAGLDIALPFYERLYQNVSWMLARALGWCTQAGEAFLLQAGSAGQYDLSPCEARVEVGVHRRNPKPYHYSPLRLFVRRQPSAGKSWVWTPKRSM